MTISYSIGKRAVTMVDPDTGAPVSIPQEHASYGTVVSFIKEGKLSQALAAMNVARTIQSFSSGKIHIVNDQVLYEDEEVPDLVADHVLQLQRDGFDVTPMVNFLTNLYENPSRTAIQETWLWLDQAGLTITHDGHFIAWKGVKSDYRDRHSGKFDNSIGANPKMQRREVNDNADKVCSYGFHVGTFEYADRFGRVDGKLMECKVNPRDVVAVASDGRTKVRVCEYLVVGEVYKESRGNNYDFVPLYDDKYEDNSDDDDADEWEWDIDDESYDPLFGPDEEDDDDDPEADNLEAKIAALPWVSYDDPNRFWHWLNENGHYGYMHKDRPEQVMLAVQWVMLRIPSISLFSAQQAAVAAVDKYCIEG